MYLLTFKNSIMPEFIFISSKNNINDIIIENLNLFKKIIKQYRITEIELNEIKDFYFIEHDIDKEKRLKKYNKETLYVKLRYNNIIDIESIYHDLIHYEDIESLEKLKTFSGIIKYNDKYNEYDFQFINNYNNLIEINCSLKWDKKLNKFFNKEKIYLVKLQFKKFINVEEILNIDISKIKINSVNKILSNINIELSFYILLISALNLKIKNLIEKSTLKKNIANFIKNNMAMIRKFNYKLKVELGKYF